jgi:hypothetical protein
MNMELSINKISLLKRVWDPKLTFTGAMQNINAAERFFGSPGSLQLGRYSWLPSR